jgi:hypothetical protein
MSASNGKWELGVVSFFDSFEEFDQFTRLGADYHTLPAANNATGNITLDNTIASNYANAPFYLYTEPTSNGAQLKGAALYMGPSSHSENDGAISRTHVTTLANNVMSGIQQGQFSVSTVPYAKFNQNDPVVIRTVPHGWTPSVTLEAAKWQVYPVQRYDDNYINVALSGGSAVTVDTTAAYAYFNQKAVRMVVNDSSDNSNRHIKRTTPINSISAHIPKYRFSYYYRLAKANPRATSDISLTSMSTANPARVHLRAMSANGNVLAALSGETLGTVTYNASLLGSSTDDLKSEFTLVTKTFGLYQTGSSTSDSPDWNMTTLTQPSTNPNDAAALRINRLEIQMALRSGVNAAFDVDDLVIEHAAGTSHENNGYYEMASYPEQGSLQWNFRRPATRNNYTINNTMKRSKTSGNMKPKHIISASFVNVPKQMFYDMRTLMGWQDRGHLISLRPYHSGLPNVLQGVISVDNFSNQMWDLGRVTFSLKFEEA